MDDITTRAHRGPRFGPRFGPGFLVGVAAALLAACTVQVDIPADWIPADVPGLFDVGDTGVPDAARPDEGVPPDSDRRDGLVPPDVPFPRDLPRDLPRDIPRFDVDRDVAADAAPDAATADVSPLPDLPYCPWNVAALPRLSQSTVLVGETFDGTTSAPHPLDNSCRVGFPNAFLPERVYLLDVPADTRVLVTARCPDWSCGLLLQRGGCTPYGKVACAYPNEPDPLAPPTAPRPHVTTVTDGLPHFVLVEATDVQVAPGAFDLRVVIERTEGHADCPVAADVPLSRLLAEGTCVGSAEILALPEGDPRRALGPHRAFALTGDTRPLADTVAPACGLTAFAAGGAPDFIVRVVADTDAPVTLAAGLVPGPEAPFDALLAVGSAPCGAATSTIDCVAAPVAPGALSPLLLFAGEEVFVMVDGVGSHLFAATDAAAEAGPAAAGDFTLSLWVADPGCDR